jgi:hypothetical protein
MTTAELETEIASAPDPRDYTNYGDVSLNLPPDWARARNIGGHAFILTTVGHENGVADAFRTQSPGTGHQFKWCNPSDGDEVSMLRTQHYELVIRSEWTKNPHLWEWDGEGHIVHNGQRLVARDRKYYDAEEREKVLQADKANDILTPEEERLLRKLQARGAFLEDEKGRPLRPMAPQ